MDALDVLCAHLTRDLFTIAKFLLMCSITHSDTLKMHNSMHGWFKKCVIFPQNLVKMCTIHPKINIWSSNSLMVNIN